MPEALDVTLEECRIHDGSSCSGGGAVWSRPGLSPRALNSRAQPSRVSFLSGNFFARFFPHADACSISALNSAPTIPRSRTGKPQHEHHDARHCAVAP